MRSNKNSTPKVGRKVSKTARKSAAAAAATLPPTPVAAVLDPATTLVAAILLIALLHYMHHGSSTIQSHAHFVVPDARQDPDAANQLVSDVIAAAKDSSQVMAFDLMRDRDQACLSARKKPVDQILSTWFAKYGRKRNVTGKWEMFARHVHKVLVLLSKRQPVEYGGLVFRPFAFNAMEQLSVEGHSVFGRKRLVATLDTVACPVLYKSTMDSLAGIFEMEPVTKAKVVEYIASKLIKQA